MLFFAVLVYSLCIRVEWLTTACTIIIGALLIAGYDFFIKPVQCYKNHLNHCLHGRTRECELPFIRLSDNIDLVEDYVSIRVNGTTTNLYCRNTCS